MSRSLLSDGSRHRGTDRPLRTFHGVCSAREAQPTCSPFPSVQATVPTAKRDRSLHTPDGLQGWWTHGIPREDMLGITEDTLEPAEGEGGGPL